jgi:N-acetyl-gamma-glutamyl-phosphate reductase
MRQRVGIVGFRGYSGAELVRILERHPNLEPVLMEHRHDVGEIRHSGAPRIACTAEAATEAGLAAVALATPADVSMDLTPKMLAAGAKVVDLSGAFRLGTAECYKRWYKEEHTAPQLLGEAVYGLPEFHRERIRPARLIANPGCYPTAANLAVGPLVASGIADRKYGVICDAKSGVSGAGRKPSLKTSFCEVAENFSAYSLLDHRHVPEVLMNSALEEAEFSFTAHLLPLDRGILETVYFRSSKAASAADVISMYRERYAGEKFVRVYDAGSVPDLKAVQRTNFCDIGVKFDAASGRGVVVCAIDNLVKGAAGQAMQNLNLILGRCETEGLL